MTMTLNLLYFAGVREKLKHSAETVELPAGASVGDLLNHLADRHPVLAPLLAGLRCAVNQEFVPLSHPLADGDEVALIPPVSGGSGEGAARCRITNQPLRLQEVMDWVSDTQRGGLVTFSGIVRSQSRGREVHHLEYEAYEPMALRVLSNILRGIETEVPGSQVAVIHRVGTLNIGEVAVVIAASAAHRGEAFLACQMAIDRLKKDVPIWKKEVYLDGQDWIGDRP